MRVLAAGLVLVAGPAESVSEYLVILNHGPGEAVVSYRPGVFRGPHLEAVAMLQKPMQSVARRHAKIGKYSVLPDERLSRSPGGVVTFTLPAGSAAMIGGIWPPTDDSPPSDGSVASLEIESPTGRSAYDGDGVLSAFSERSKNLRILAVQ